MRAARPGPSSRGSRTTWRIGTVFQEGKRSPQSSRGRPNWLKPATGSNVPAAGRTRRSLRGIGTARAGGRPAAALAAAPAVGEVNRVVEAPGRAVDAELLVPLGEPGQHDLADVGPTVAVGVLEVNQVRGGRDEHAAVPGEHAARPVQAVGEHRGVLVAAVAVAVLEPLDPARGRATG